MYNTDAKWLAHEDAWKSATGLVFSDYAAQNFKRTSRIVRYFGVSDIEAEEAANIALWKAYRGIRGLRKGKFDNWFLEICRNTAIDISRKETSQYANARRIPSRMIVSLEEMDSDDLAHLSAMPVYEDEWSDRKIALREAARRLPASYKLTFELHYYHGFSYGEISKSFGLSESTVRSRINRARKIVESEMRSPRGNDERNEMLQAEGN